MNYRTRQLLDELVDELLDEYNRKDLLYWARLLDSLNGIFTTAYNNPARTPPT